MQEYNQFHNYLLVSFGSSYHGHLQLHLAHFRFRVIVYIKIQPKALSVKRYLVAVIGD